MLFDYLVYNKNSEICLPVNCLDIALFIFNKLTKLEEFALIFF